MYERLKRWTGFWLTVRRAPGAELPYYQHGNDSGWDNATTFDPGRVIVTADLTAFLVLQLRELDSLARELGRPDEASRWAAIAEEIQAALLDQLWTGERFVARSAGSGETWSSASLLDLMPIALGEHLPTEVTSALADHIKAHMTPYGLATELTTSPTTGPTATGAARYGPPPPSSSRTAYAAPATSGSRTTSAPASAPCARPMGSPRTSTP